jgi:hypothetical protein
MPTYISGFALHQKQSLDGRKLSITNLVSEHFRFLGRNSRSCRAMSLSSVSVWPLRSIYISDWSQSCFNLRGECHGGPFRARSKIPQRTRRVPLVRCRATGRGIQSIFGSSQKCTDFQLWFDHGGVSDEGRVPRSRILCIGSIPDHKLCFSQWSQSRHSYVAGYKPSPGKKLWGVLWTIPETELSNLDRFESYRPDRKGGHSFERVRVELHRENREPIHAETYRTVGQEDGIPSRSYLDLMIVGATENELPSSYRKELRKTPRIGNPLPSTMQGVTGRINKFFTYFTDHPGVMVGTLYIYVSFLGVLYNSIVLTERGINPVKFYGVDDFLLGGLRHPYILILIAFVLIASGLNGTVALLYNRYLEYQANAQDNRKFFAQSRLYSLMFRVIQGIHWLGRLSTYYTVVVAIVLVVVLPLILPWIANEFTGTCHEDVVVAMKPEPRQNPPQQASQSNPPQQESQSKITGALIGSTARFLFITDERNPLVNRVVRLDEVRDLTITHSKEYPAHRWRCLLFH